jgi:hypothetical protein
LQTSFLRQVYFPGVVLPPLYFTTAPSPFAIAQLEDAKFDIGSSNLREPLLSPDIMKLRSELEEGMGRERRERVMEYVTSLERPRERDVAELYLARYALFALDGDGRLKLLEGKAVHAGKGDEEEEAVVAGDSAL